MILVARLVDGILGSNLTLTKAYLGDISTGKDRTKYFGYLSAVMGLGFLLGPAVGGFLSQINFALPAFLAAGVSFISIILTILYLTETVRSDHTTDFNLDMFFPIHTLANSIKNPKLQNLLVQYFCFYLAFVLFTSNAGLFVDYQLGFGAKDVGMLFLVVGLTRVIFQTIFFPKMITRFKKRFLILSGTIILALTLFSLYFIRLPIQMYVGTLFFAIGAGLTHPTLNAYINEFSDNTDRGKLMGLTSSLQSISQIIGPLAGGFIINNYYPGILGLLAGSLMLIAILLNLLSR